MRSVGKGFSTVSDLVSVHDVLALMVNDGPEMK